MDNLFPENLYHSYIVEGDPETTSLDLRKFLEERGEVEVQSPDVLFQMYDSFTMTDSQKIKQWHSESGITDGKRICIIGTKFINREAERTLLKIIEEPAVNTHFFLVVPNALVLLDTIRSRTHTIKINNLPKDSPLGYPKGQSFGYNEEEVKKFISLSPKDRIDFITKIIKKHKDLESSGRLRFVAIQLINEIEKNIFEKFKLNKNDKNNQFVLQELQKNREYLNSPGCSVKMILEHLALVI